MKIFLIIAILFLSACSSEDSIEQAMETNPAISDKNTTEEVQSSAQVLMGESTVFAPYTSTVELTVEDEKLTEISFDEFLEDGTSKVTASMAGTYGSDTYTLGEYHEQVAALEAYILENNQFPTLSNGIDVDSSSGASVNLSGFEEAYNQALATKQ